MEKVYAKERIQMSQSTKQVVEIPPVDGIWEYTAFLYDRDSVQLKQLLTLILEVFKQIERIY